MLTLKLKITTTVKNIISDTKMDKEQGIKIYGRNIL
jgi:hypothetical protein